MARNTDGEISEIWAENAGDNAPPGVTFDDGWGITYSQTGGPKPERTGFNYLFNKLYSMGKDVSQYGAALPWSGTVDFLQGAVVSYSGVVYIALQASGPGGAGAQQPDTSPAYWSSDLSGSGGSNREFILIQDQKPNNTPGGQPVAGTFNTRVLNTVLINTLTGATLASNQITLAAGTYKAEWSCPVGATSSGGGPDRHRSRLRNITDNTDTGLGDSRYLSVQTIGSQASGQSIGRAIFTIASSKVFELQHYVQAANSTVNFGNFSGSGLSEVYSQIMIERIN